MADYGIKSYSSHCSTTHIDLTQFGIDDAMLCSSNNKLWLDFYDNLRIYLNHKLIERFIKKEINKIELDNLLKQEKFIRTLKLLMPELLLHTQNKLTNRLGVFVSEATNLPCIGTRYYGVIDRSTNIIELRPNTGCNQSCVFCSVGEGFDIKKNDFIVDYKYLKSWVDYVSSFKDSDLEVLINPQGEPLLYPRLTKLIEVLKSNKKVKKVSLVTNGLLLKQKADQLIKSGLDSFHVSFQGFTNLKRFLGVDYPSNIIAETLKHISNKKIEIWLTPVWIKGLNDKQIREVVAFGKQLKKNSNAKVIIAIQNYLVYKSGKSIPNYRQASWDEFDRFLAGLERDYNIALRLKKLNVGIFKDNPIPKPLKTNQVVKARLVCVGRTDNETIAVIGEGFDARAIIVNAPKSLIGRRVKIKIKHSLHNIYYATML